MRGSALVLVAVALVLLPAAPVRAQVNPCPAQAQFDWQGRSLARAVTVQEGVSAAYPGTVLRPAGPRRTLGRRPGVVLMHGHGGTQCGLWWAARHLAGHGYVTLVLTHDGNLTGHELAVRTGVRWLRSPSNPFRGLTRGGRIGLAGHSQGSNAAMLAQDEPGVKALAALDSLKRHAQGDPAAAIGCTAPRRPIAPLVPALGFAMDLPCADRPTLVEPDLKKTGHALWKSASRPTMTLVMRGFQHSSFTARGTEEQLRHVGHFLLAWLDRYLSRDRTATRRILARRVNGIRTRQLLSTTFRSAAYLPARIDCEDYAECVRRPARARRHGPSSGRAGSAPR
jgi:dienelactone hydrolase